MTWWPRKGTTEWVQYDFKTPKRITGASVYWFDDDGGCRIPKSWRLLYKDGGRWKPVPNLGARGLEKDKFNSVKFDPVQTTGLRLEVQLQPASSAGLLEWRVDTDQ